MSTTTDLRVVCDEVLPNVVAHGFPVDGEHEIEVSVGLAGPRLVLSVSDDGVPFDPLAVAPPDTSQPLEDRNIGGLGIHLVRHLVDDLTYERRAERNVLTVVMTVDRPGAPTAPDGAPAETRPAAAHAVDASSDTRMEIRTRRQGDVLIADIAGRRSGRPRNFKEQYKGVPASSWRAYSGRKPRILQFASDARIGTQPTCDANRFNGDLNTLIRLTGHAPRRAAA